MATVLEDNTHTQLVLGKGVSAALARLLLSYLLANSIHTVVAVAVMM